MSEVCIDNRFKVIEKAKQHLLEATNIDTSPDEMKVLDNFLFRCWQMGWLDKYDTQKVNEEFGKILCISEYPIKLTETAELGDDSWVLSECRRYLGEE